MQVIHGENQVDYRSLLEREFRGRCARNYRYSLRAFARDLEIYPARLSEILSGKKGLSALAAQALVKKMDWSELEADFFVTLVEAKSSRHPLQRKAAQAKLRKQFDKRLFSEMSLEHFEVMGHWLNFAILELLKIDNRALTPTSLSLRFGVSEQACADALLKLKKLKYLKVDKKGRYVDAFENMATPETPSRAIKNYHHQILRKAGEVIENTELSQRDFSALTMAIDSEKIPEAKAMLKEFRRRFAADQQNTRKKDRIYCLSLQFFPLDKEIKP